jgi:hypothetical protein
MHVIASNKMKNEDKSQNRIVVAGTSCQNNDADVVMS